MFRDGAPGSRTLDAASAQLVAWCLVGVVNQGLILALAPPAPLGVQAMHHVYDFGQLVALGVLSFAAARLGELAATRLPGGARLKLALLASTVFAVSMLIVGDDLDNFARRRGVSTLLVSLTASTVLSLLLTSTRFLPAFRRGWQRA